MPFMIIRSNKINKGFGEVFSPNLLQVKTTIVVDWRKTLWKI